MRQCASSAAACFPVTLGRRHPSKNAVQKNRGVDERFTSNLERATPDQQGHVDIPATNEFGFSDLDVLSTCKTLVRSVRRGTSRLDSRGESWPSRGWNREGWFLIDCEPPPGNSHRQPVYRPLKTTVDICLILARGKQSRVVNVNRQRSPRLTEEILG